jgi:hypothetical protein
MTRRSTNEVPFLGHDRESFVHGLDILFGRLPSGEALRRPF